MAQQPNEADSRSGINFGRVLKTGDAGVSETRTWLYVVPVLAVIVFLVVFSFTAISRSSGLKTQLTQASTALQESQKAIEERDKLLTAARADEQILKSPGQAVVVLTAGPAGGAANGVALVHPDQHAVALYLFGLSAPPPGQQYKVFAKPQNGPPKPIAAIEALDEAGRAFAIARDVPAGPLQLTVAMAPAKGDQPAASPPTAVLSAPLPAPTDRGGVMLATQAKVTAKPTPAPRSHGRRTPSAAAKPPATAPRGPEVPGAGDLALPTPGK